MNTEILSILTGMSVKDPSSVIEQGYIGDSPLTANCLIKTFEVHSVCRGTVLAIEKEPNFNYWCITVEVDSQHWVRYMSMASYKIKVGQNISKGDFIGYGYRGMMRFEYCISTQSQFPVRIIGKQLYKADPTPILFGMENLETL